MRRNRFQRTGKNFLKGRAGGRREERRKRHKVKDTEEKKEKTKKGKKKMQSRFLECDRIGKQKERILGREGGGT